MKKTLTLISILLCFFTSSARADLNVFACEPEWAALAMELGGDKLTVTSATSAQQDPHHIEARPSLIAKLRQADLAVCTGAELEIGWMPMLLRQAGNDNVQPGQPGHFEAVDYVERMEVLRNVDRSMGDVHAGGNPHVHTDPRRIALVAEKLAERLAQLDGENAAHYRVRYQAFARRWKESTAQWAARGAPLKDMRVVTHHKDWVYLIDWLGLIDAGTLEPKPGVPPSAAHLATLKQALAKNPARLILRSPIQDARASEWLARESGARAVMLPYTVGGTPAAKDLFGLFDDTLARLTDAAK